MVTSSNIEDYEFEGCRHDKVIKDESLKLNFNKNDRYVFSRSKGKVMAVDPSFSKKKTKK